MNVTVSTLVYTTSLANACMCADVRVRACGVRRAVLRDVARARGDAAERAALGRGAVPAEAVRRVCGVVPHRRVATAPTAVRASRVVAAAQPERVILRHIRTIVDE